MNSLPHGPRTTDHGPRAAFTMVEVIVVTGIIMVLGAMVVLVSSGIKQRDMVASGSTDVQGWAKMCQVWALRDQRTYGIRLKGAYNPGPYNATTNAGNQVTQLLFIQQPDDYVPPNTTITLSGNTATASGGTFPAASVAADDFLEVYTGATAKLHRITTATTTTLTLAPNWAGAATSTGDYRIVRRARVRGGEPALNLPPGVVIDVRRNSVFAAQGGALPAHNPATGDLDILFSPDGRVITPGAQGSDLKLWVRDTNSEDPTNPYLKSPLLVVISLNSGLIAVHPVNPDTVGDPYIYTRDGRSSGF